MRTWQNGNVINNYIESRNIDKHINDILHKIKGIEKDITNIATSFKSPQNISKERKKMADIEIDGSNNTTLIGDNITVNNSEDKKQKEISSNFLQEYRKYFIEYEWIWLIIGILFLSVFTRPLFGFSTTFNTVLTFEVIVLSLWWLAPMKYDNLYFNVKTDKIELNNKTIHYKDISKYGYKKSTFWYQLHGYDYKKEIIVALPKEAEFIFDTVKRYSYATGTNMSDS